MRHEIRDMRPFKKVKILLLFSLIIPFSMFVKNSFAQVTIGVFADCQYCDCEKAGNRYYRNSLAKLEDCIMAFNQKPNVEFVVGLGDLIDRDLNSFGKVNEVLEKSVHPVYHVTGNHDYSVEEEQLDRVPEQLNLKKTYYSITTKGWHFIFLNGNEITLQSTDRNVVKQAENMLSELKDKKSPNANDWNGAIGEKQLEWLQKELVRAEKKKRKAVLFCHYPLQPYEAHCLWNAEEVLSVLDRYTCVKAWVNGHNHAGNYSERNGVHHITLKGMVDTATENAFSLFTFTKERIEVKGFGREESRNLGLR